MDETDSGYKDYLARIRHLRKKAGLNQTQMGKILGISQPYYANIENGSRTTGFHFISKICIEFDVSADWLLFGKNPPQIEGE